MKPIDCSLTNIYKTDHAPFPYKKGQRQITNIRNEKEDITSDAADIKI